MSINLTQASNQWATRPDDERFWNLSEMKAATSFHRKTATEATVDFANTCITQSSRHGIAFNDLTADADVGRSGISHYAFGQLCRTFEAPASYLRTLPVDLAVECLETGRRRFVMKDPADRQLLYQGRGTDEATLRAATSDKYVRVWNDEIVERLQQLETEGWVVPSARPHTTGGRTRIATESDVIDYGHESALTVKVGDVIGPAGLYASDHDMFAFMIHPDIEINDGESPHGLRRGTMIRQSEVGDCSIWKLDFLLNTVCGNHIVWNASDIRETRVRHLGSGVKDKWSAMVRSVSDYKNTSAVEQEAKIRESKEFILGASKDDVIDALFARRLLGRRDAGAAYDMAEEFESVHGNPRSVWGMVQGVTRLSQATPYADARAKLDMAAGKILSGHISLN